jgi:Protein of unknown function (DUF3313)
MRWVSLFVLALLLLAGCAKVAQQAGITEHEMPVSGKGQLLRGTNVHASGFLRDYSELAPVKGVTGEWEYVRKGVDWKPYTKITLRPMEVWVNPGADYPAIQPDLYKKVEDTIKQIVTKEFEEGGYQVVDKPGPGVLVFHYALTGVTPVRQGLLPSDALPLKAAITAVRYATGTEAYYVALSGELEALDGASGERVFAVVGARRSFATELKGDEITWDELHDVVTYFAKQWRTRLDHGRGVTTG